MAEEKRITGKEILRDKVAEEIPSLSGVIDFFHDDIPDLRENRIVQIVLVRETLSYTKFTTDGEEIDKERTIAGLLPQHRFFIDRAVMLKRKQVAAERRTGKEFLRAHYDNSVPVEVRKCALTEDLCGRCPDCFLYGYAAQKEGAEGSRRSRVYTDTSFSILPASLCIEMKQQNAVKEKFGVEEKGETLTGQALWEFEYVKPQILFPSVETLIDVTLPEFLYVLYNITRTKRYGAEKSTGGLVENHIIGIYFLSEERFSNLLLTQKLYDLLSGKLGENIRDAKIDNVKEVFGDVEKHFLGDIDGKVAISLDVVKQFSDFINEKENKKLLVSALLQDVENWLAEKNLIKNGKKKGRKKKGAEEVKI